jgi:tryptophan synthase alpha chain
MSSINRVFERLQARGEGALIGYVTAGDPAPEQTPLIADALIEGGVDILELGLPFSDPIADGPTIQAASVRALAAGTTPMLVLEMAREIKRKHDTPIVVMTYYNPVFKMGLERFLRLAKACLVDALIIPDLPVEEAADYIEKARVNVVGTIFLAAPSTSTDRLKKIVACSSGFLYLVSQFGVTGEREKIEDSTIQLIKRVLPYTKGHVPLAVGFGISKPEHARCVIEAGADGVIVGSAFVNAVHKNAGSTGKIGAEIGALARQFKAATYRRH